MTKICKYKHFVVIIGLFYLYFIFQFFTIAYDGNDDQIMQFIVSGELTDISDVNIIFQHFLIGELLKWFYLRFPSLNWYVIWLIGLQVLSFVVFAYSIFGTNNIGFKNSSLFVGFYLFGIQSLTVTALQFTTVAFMLGIAGIFCLISDLQRFIKLFLTCVVFLMCALVRNHVFFIIALFVIPLVFYKYNLNRTRFYSILSFLTFLSLTVFMSYINVKKISIKNNYYEQLVLNEILINSPICINEHKLKEINFSYDDIRLIQSWYGTDKHYFQNEQLRKLAEESLVYRNINEVYRQFKTFISDERYILFVYIFSFVTVLLFSKKNKHIVLVNLLLFLLLFIYLIIFRRIPRRVTMPVISYISLFNFLLILKNNTKNIFKERVMYFALLLSFYKAYCVYKLSNVNKSNNKKYELVLQDINNHPDKLFIAQYYPLQLMKADFKRVDYFKNNNIVFTGWYINTPNYNKVLSNNNIDNLTEGLLQRKDVLFLCDSESFETAFINVIKQRYNTTCHFEQVNEGFNYLKPKKLVVDN